jgi:hypothetical protein
LCAVIDPFMHHGAEDREAVRFRAEFDYKIGAQAPVLVLRFRIQFNDTALFGP